MNRWCQTVFVYLLLFAIPVFGQTQPPSIMQREWLAHEGRPYDLHPGVRIAPMLRSGSTEVRKLEVMGYLPYWNMGKAVLHPETLSVLAYFGVSCNSDGSLNNAHHWGTADFRPVIDACHAHGVKVVLTVTNFKSSSIQALLSSQTARNKLINNLVNLVVQAGGDGVNVDFEGLPSAVKNQFVDFMGALKTAMESRVSGSHVSIATPAIDWSGAFDYDRLAAVTDALFIMGYDYHWSSSNPGPVSPLKGGGIWGQYSLTWTVDDYLKYGGETNRYHFILGLPLYAYDWACENAVVPGKRVDGTRAEPVIWSVTQAEAADNGGWRWDNSSDTVFYMYKTDHVHQVWGDNLQSMQKKIDLIRTKDIGGMGFWALGYANDQKLWDAIHAAAFETLPDTADDDGRDAYDAYEDIAELTDSSVHGDLGNYPRLQDTRIHAIPGTGFAEIRMPGDNGTGFVSSGRASSGCGSCSTTSAPHGVLPFALLPLLLFARRKKPCSR